MKFNDVYNIDCIEGMKQLKDKSVDFLLTDIPYDEVNKYVDEHGQNDFRELKKQFADTCSFYQTELFCEV